MTLLTDLYDMWMQVDPGLENQRYVVVVNR